MIFGWSILSLLSLTYARAITVCNSPLVHTKRKPFGTSRTKNDTTSCHGSNEILDPSRSLEERFPIRGGAAAVEKEGAWVEGAKNSLASALAAAFSKTILAPFDTIKTLQQYYQTSPNMPSLTLVEAAKIILERPGGFLNFYVSGRLL